MPAGQAVNAHKVQTRNWLAEIVAELTYADFASHGIKLPEYERCVFLATADLFDEDSESYKILSVHPAKVDDIRAGGTYLKIKATLLERVEVYRSAVDNDEDWLRREADFAKRVVSRNLRHGSDSTRLTMARDILDRQIPKKRREGEDDGTKVFLIFSEQHAELMERAARVARKVLPKPVEKLLPAAPES